jgi:hypothetical protein
MNNKSNDESVGRHRTLQWVVFGVSIVFFAVLSNGYFNLFISKGEFLSGIIGVIFAGIAWGLAKFIGSSDGRIKANAPLFVLLLIISAVGVFNSLMVNLEGKRIFQEAIDDSSFKFNELMLQANKLLSNPALEAKRARVEKLKSLFFSELRNPINCGQGKAAMQLAQDLRNELPEFQMLSGRTKRGNCANIESLIKSYGEQVDNLLNNSVEFTKARYIEILDEKDKIRQKEQEAQEELARLKNNISNGVNSLNKSRLELEKLASKYQLLIQGLGKYSSGLDIPVSLDIGGVRNLGEWSQLINLIISRLDKPATYVYLSLSVFFDWILVYLFGRLVELKESLPSRKPLPTTDISTPW